MTAGSPEGGTSLTISILTALEQLGEGVMIVDSSRVLPVYMNEAMERISGYTLEEFQIMPGGLFSTLDPKQAGVIQDRMVRRLAGEEVPSYYEVSITHKDGTKIQIETAVQLVKGQPDLIVSIVRDVTERKRMQEQSHRTERINAMGHMATGTAHDFNNLLASILGEADLLLDLLDADPVNWGDVHRGIEDIRETAQLGARFAKRLLEIGKSRGLTVQSVNVREVIEKMEPILVRVISDQATLEMRLCDEDCSARLFPDELEQVVLNLVLNASDALDGQGTIGIETSHRTDGRIDISVSDDGPGIPAEVQGSMFEPFFTTKGSGRGTGLGLSVVDAIVTRARGAISVDTAPDRGTKVTVSLPATRSGDSDKI